MAPQPVDAAEEPYRAAATLGLRNQSTDDIPETAGPLTSGLNDRKQRREHIESAPVDRFDCSWPPLFWKLGGGGGGGGGGVTW